MDLKLLPRINGHILSRFGLRLERTRPLRRQVVNAGPGEPVPIEGIDDFRFRSIDWTYSVPVSQMVGRPVFGYGPASWHPLTAACRELIADPDAPYESSVLRRFYQSFTPSTVAEAQAINRAQVLAQIPANSLFEPWILRTPPNDDPFMQKSGTPLFGPVGDQKARAEWERIRDSVASVLKFGYQPDLFPRGRIGITVLRSRGEQRYLVEHGQHRAAVLAALGETRVEVGIFPKGVRVVDEREVADWPYVKSGFLPEQEAVSSIRRYFVEPEADPALRIARRIEA